MKDDYIYFDGTECINFKDLPFKIKDFKYKVQISTKVERKPYGSGWSCGRYNDWLHENSIPYLSKRILENPKTYYFLESKHAIMFKLRFEGTQNGERI